MQTIIGQFSKFSQAQDAVDALLQRNYDKADISFVANQFPDRAGVGDDDAAAHATTAVLGLLIGAGAMMVPGVGVLFAAGPLGLGIAEAAAGVAQQDAHWLGGALAKHGVPDRDARAYGDVVQRGGALVILGSREVSADNIKAILKDCGAAAITTHARDPGDSGA